MNKTPKISVILPVYNGMQYLKESVNSVINQNYDDFEFLICDDCSTDGSYEYLRTLKSDKLFLFRNQKNLGLFSTLNILVKKSKSPLIHLWSQDDIMLPDCLEEAVKFHDKYPQVNFSFSRWLVIDKQGKIIDKGFETTDKTLSPIGHAKSSILYGSISGNISNVCVLKKAVEEVGYFNENMKYSGDFDMWYKLSVKNPVGLSAAYTIKLRRHENQLSRKLDFSIYKLVDNLSIYRNFLTHFQDKQLKIAKRALKWKINTFYYNHLLFIMKNNNKLLVKKYKKELKEYDNLNLLFIRWLIIRILRILRLENKFYEKFIISKF